MRKVGTNGKVKTGSTGGNTVAELNEWNYQKETTPITGQSFGDDLEKAEAGIRKITGNLTGFYDPSDTDGQATLVDGAKVRLDLYPDGDGSGDTYESFSEVFISNVSVGARVGEYVSFSASWQANALPTVEVVA